MILYDYMTRSIYPRTKISNTLAHKFENDGHFELFLLKPEDPGSFPEELPEARLFVFDVFS